MEFRAAIYMSFKKTQCSLNFIVINVIIINFEGLDQIFSFKIKTLPTTTKIPKSTKENIFA
jgi:hypothetical protein